MKILVISHNCFSKIYNNGKTLSALFSNYSRNELCQLYFIGSGSPDFDRCLDYYFFSDNDAFKSIIYKEYKHRKTVSLNENKSRFIQNQKVKKIIPKNQITLYIRNLVWYMSNWFNADLENWLKTQKPDVIFFVGGNATFSHKIALTIKKYLNLPMAVYFTDDYIVKPRHTWYINKLEKIYKQTVAQSSLCFAIGDKMAKLYSGYFSKSFIPVMNVVKQEKRNSMNLGRSIIINYFGGLHLGRYKALLKFFQQLKSCDVMDQFKLGIYTFSVLSDKQKAIIKSHKIELYKGISGKELESSMKETDIFIHVESAEKRYKELTLFSVSTKIPEYMMYSRPIIAVGPHEQASIELIESVDKNLVFYNDEDGYVENKLQSVFKILTDKDKLSEIAKKNYDYAIAHYSREIVSVNFRKKLDALLPTAQ